MTPKAAGTASTADGTDVTVGCKLVININLLLKNKLSQMSPATTAVPSFQILCSKSSRPVSCRSEKNGGSISISTEKKAGEIQTSSESSECRIEACSAPSNHGDHLTPKNSPKNHRSTDLSCLIDIRLLGKNATIFDLVNDNGGADPSIIGIEPNDEFGCFESIESPRADADAEHRAWLEQRNYRAWFAARNLHLQ